MKELLLEDSIYHVYAMDILRLVSKSALWLEIDVFSLIATVDLKSLSALWGRAGGV